MSDDGFRGTVSEFGDAKVKDLIHERYLEQLKPPMMWGEPLGDGDLGEVNTGFRKYDHGEASNQTVQEVGVKVVFDPEKTKLADLQEGGRIREDLTQIARQHFTCDLLKFDLTFVTEDEYVVWLIADTSQLIG